MIARLSPHTYTYVQLHICANGKCLSLTVQMYCFNLILISSSHQHCSVHIISYCFCHYIRSSHILYTLPLYMLITHTHCHYIHSSHIHTAIIYVFLLHIIYVLHYIIMYFTYSTSIGILQHHIYYRRLECITVCCLILECDNTAIIKRESKTATFHSLLNSHGTKQ